MSIALINDEEELTLWLKLMPAVFVLIWSTGFIVAKFGLPYAPAAWFLILRCLSVVILLFPALFFMKVVWPSKRQCMHIAIAGTLLQAGYLGGVWGAIKLGMPAGVSALIVGMQPVLTGFAAPLLGERVNGHQWIGLTFGISGVALVVANKISLIGLSHMSIMLCLVALFSITIGTLYQKRFCPRFDLRVGSMIQFAASALVLLPFALLFESFSIQWAPKFIGALCWAVLVSSIGGMFLLFPLIQRGAATKVTSLFYLTPPVTAIIAWLMFGERFSLFAIAGMGLAIIGVVLVVNEHRLKAQ